MMRPDAITSINQQPIAINRNNTIQFLRALAIIAVVLIHDCPPDERQIYCRPFINFAVALFLFISGYLTKDNQRDWKQFYKKRITRVLIPYLIWGTLYSFITIWRLADYPRAMLTTTAYLHLYYIFIYIQFVLLTPLMLRLARSRYRTLGWLITPISVLLLQYYELFTGIIPPNLVLYLRLDLCFEWFTFYYLGLLLGNNMIDCKWSWKTLAILYCLSIPLQMIESHIWIMHGIENYGGQLKLTSILTSTLVLLLANELLKKENIQINNRFLMLLGDYSFGIYLSHLMLRVFLDHIPLYKSLPYGINSALLILITLGFCYWGSKLLGNKLSRWIGLK